MIEKDAVCLLSDFTVVAPRRDGLPCQFHPNYFM